MYDKIFMSADHGGFKLKNHIFNLSNKMNFETVDLGTVSLDSVDYPDYSNLLTEKLKKNKNSCGILFCGTGIGMSIAANRYSHIRAALCTSIEMASLSRKHNDANVLVLGGRILDSNIAKDIFIEFLNTKFEEGRHKNRLNKL
jgi:ribose 5-phosphate isomerase B